MPCLLLLFFLNDTAPTEIYTLSLHDALPIWVIKNLPRLPGPAQQELKVRSLLTVAFDQEGQASGRIFLRSEEHTSELQSLTNLVCRLLLEKKKKKIYNVKSEYRTMNTNKDTE